MFIRPKLMVSFLFFFLISLSVTVNLSAGDLLEAAQDVETGTVTGRVVVEGKVDSALAWGQVMFYNVETGPLPLPYKYERTPDVSRDLDVDGGFSLELPAGVYYISAVKRLSGDRLGPPQLGDYVSRDLNETKKPKKYSIKAGEVLQLGELEAIKLSAENLSERRITTAIEGTVIDAEGKPVVGAVVVAFSQSYIGKKPLFVSDKTDTNGKYILPLIEGTYFLRARNSFAAGPPQPGQIVGYFGEGRPAPIKVQDCEILKDINFDVIVFRGRGPGLAPVVR